MSFLPDGWEDHEHSSSSHAGMHDLCRYALPFAAWCQELLAVFAVDPTRLMLMRLKLELQDRFHEVRYDVPQSHREHVGNRGHTCIWQVYVRTYQELRSYERRFLDSTFVEGRPRDVEPPEDEPPDAVSLGDLIDDSDDDESAAS